MKVDEMMVPVPQKEKPPEHKYIDVLATLTLDAANAEKAVAFVAGLTEARRSELLALADSHHVILRALDPVRNYAAHAGDSALLAWADAAIHAEHARIDNALEFLDRICKALEEAGCPVSVMKSLEHWPDMGSDLDLFTTGDEQVVVRVFTRKFNARIEDRSWGDRLANKWNFSVPGLRESVEVHAKRLGQTGEHTALARRFVSRRVSRTLNGYTFQVPAPEEAIIVATLQRMYRHFYFRLCDIVDSARLADSKALDYDELRRAANLGGIWPGVATYLKIVSDYVEEHRGRGLELPREVTAAALFGGEKIFVRDRFLRVPIIPQGAQLYTRQVTNAALRGDVPATFRLTLLPYLASAAAVAYKLTGSDKGIW